MESYSQDDNETSDISSRWFKMPSRLWDTEVGSDPYLLQLLAYLCDRARISDGPVSLGEGKGRRNFMLAAGELIVGRLQAAKDLKCPPSTVRNRLQKLVEIGLIATRPCKKYTIVTIIFLVQESSKKKRAKKDSRKQTVHPTNSLTDSRTGDAKRTTEGQPKNERLASDFVGESASTVHEKGQQKDNRRTTEGQQKDTNKKDEKIRRKEGERDSLPLDSIFSILQDAEFRLLQDADRDQAAREIADEYQLGNVGPDTWTARLRQIARLKMSRSPKRFDIFESAPSTVDPSDAVTSTFTPSASASVAVPAFDPPSELTVQRFFETEIYPSQHRFHYESHTAFRRMWHCQGWQRDNEYIDWKKEAMRPKQAASASTASQPPVPSPPVPSTSTTSTLPTAPLPSAPAKSAAEFIAELERATR